MLFFYLFKIFYRLRDFKGVSFYVYFTGGYMKSQAELLYHKTVAEISVQVAERKRKRGVRNTLYNYQAPKTSCTSFMALIKAGFTYEQAIEFLKV